MNLKKTKSPIRIPPHFTYWLNEIICYHLSESILVRHEASLLMENKLALHPMETLFRTVKARKLRHALDGYSFAISACRHLSSVEVFYGASCIVFPAAPFLFSKEPNTSGGQICYYFNK